MVVYQARKENMVVDALSRRKESLMLRIVYAKDEPCVFDISSADWCIWDILQEAVFIDGRALEICKKFETPGEEAVWYQLMDRLLYYKEYVYVLGVARLHEEILAHFHNNKEGGCLGWLRTYTRVKHVPLGRIKKISQGIGSKM